MMVSRLLWSPRRSFGAVLVLSSALGGCVGSGSLLGADTVSVGEPVAIVDLSPVRIPWQLTPASTASEAQGEVTQVFDVPGHGLVRATPVAVGFIDTPMTPFRHGGGRVVRACRSVVSRQARGIGAFRIDSGVSGPLRRSRRYEGTDVFFRIFYRRDGGLTEVRQAALRCVVNHAGRLVRATPV